MDAVPVPLRAHLGPDATEGLLEFLDFLTAKRGTP